MDIFRDLRAFPGSIYSADIGRVPRAVLEAQVLQAQREAEAASQRATDDHARRRAAGEKQACTIPLEDRRRGSESNQARRDANIEAIYDHFAAHPELEHMTTAERAQALNRAGISNVQSRTTGRASPWTASSLRKPWKQVLQKAASIAASRPTVSAGALSPAVPASPSIPAPATPAVFKSCTPLTGMRPVAPERPSDPRPLTDDEKKKLQAIMDRYGLSQSDVMDALGLPRLDASRWSAMRCGTRVRPDLLNRLADLFRRYPL